MRAARQTGFTLLELMLVVLVLGILVTIAVPAYVAASDRAAVAVLEANAQSIADKVAEFVMDGRSFAYRQSGSGGEQFVSSALEGELETDEGKGHYGNDQGFVNPVSGSSIILNSRSVNGNESQPALFMTDGRAYRYDRIRVNPARLAGTVIVQFNTQLDTIDVFYMDPEGKPSEMLIRRPVSDAVH